MTAYWCERAWLGGAAAAEVRSADVSIEGRSADAANVGAEAPSADAGADGVVAGVLVEVEGERITSVTLRADPQTGAERLAGLTIPGFANCHSHAFHRALRARTQTLRGTFWTWREAMYAVAARLDPDSYYELARSTYAEMLLTGITAVGEFHYLHHGDGGRPYDDPNAMGEALVAAALDAGMRICLLDTCYLSAGFGAEPEGVQLRLSDGTAGAWSERVRALAARHDDERVVIATAAHSVRAVPRPDLSAVAAAIPEAPLHIHLSEQVAENEACLETYGCTPTRLLADEGLLGERLSAVHATHLSDEDVKLLGSPRVFALLCPTTERDLADGIGPARKLVDAGARLTLGSDSHAVIDMFEEMRAVELDERLASQRRGHFGPAELLTAATATGHESLGFADAGRIEPGAWADLVTVDLASPRTAGAADPLQAATFAASASDVISVVASGRKVAVDGAELGQRLATAIGDLVGDSSVEADMGGGKVAGVPQ